MIRTVDLLGYAWRLRSAWIMDASATPQLRLLVGKRHHLLLVAYATSAVRALVGGGPIGVAIDALLWPVLLAALSSDDITCLPRPLNE